jgi:hypothetical protein
MSRRSKSRERGRDRYREYDSGPVLDDREAFDTHLNKDKVRIYEFVERQLLAYYENRSTRIVTLPKSWDLSKETGNLEIPFRIKGIPDCTVFCREIETLLETRKPILEYNEEEGFILKLNYQDLKQASRRMIRIWSCFGHRNQVVQTIRDGFVVFGIAAFLWFLMWMIFY